LGRCNYVLLVYIEKAPRSKQENIEYEKWVEDMKQKHPFFRRKLK